MAEKTLEEMREAVEEIRAKMAAAAREAGRSFPVIRRPVGSARSCLQYRWTSSP